MRPGDAVTPAQIDRHVRANVHAGSSLYALDEARLAALDPDLIVTQELCAVCAVSYEIALGRKTTTRRSAGRLARTSDSLEDVAPTSRGSAGWSVPRPGRRPHLRLARARSRCCAPRPRAASRPRALVLEWTDPPMSGGHWTPGLVELAGGTPILAHPGANSQTLTWEAIAAADPEVAIVVPCGYGLPEARAAAQSLLDANPGVGAGRARSRQRPRVSSMDGNAYVNRPGPRLLDSAELFAGAIAGVDGPANAIVPLVS